MKLSDINIQNVFLDQLYENLLRIVQMFEEEVRSTTLYFAFIPGDEFVHEQEQMFLNTIEDLLKAFSKPDGLSFIPIY